MDEGGGGGIAFPLWVLEEMRRAHDWLGDLHEIIESTASADLTALHAIEEAALVQQIFRDAADSTIAMQLILPSIYRASVALEDRFGPGVWPTESNHAVAN